MRIGRTGVTFRSLVILFDGIHELAAARSLVVYEAPVSLLNWLEP
jgi:hypothetical protein